MSIFESAGQEYDPDQKNTEPITEFDRRIWASIAKMGQFTPKDFKSYMIEWFTLNQPLIPIGQIVGYPQQRANYAEVLTEETTASTTYTDLATAGPSLTGLSDGQYVVLFGAFMALSVTGSAYMSVDVNGAGAADADSARMAVDSNAIGASASRGLIKDLSAGSNTLTAKYRVTAGTGSFVNRWIIAIRIANL